MFLINPVFSLNIFISEPPRGLDRKFLEIKLVYFIYIIRYIKQILGYINYINYASYHIYESLFER